MNRVPRFLTPGLVLTAAASAALASSLGPILGVTGAPALGNLPAEPTCNQSACHTGNPVNLNGSLEILGLPAEYTPGAEYTVTVRLTSSATQNFIQRRWGFEVTAVSQTDGTGAGSFASNSLLVRTGDARSGSRPYVSHDGDTFQPGAVSPVEWSFTWTAPSTDAGNVGFYAAGNAANGNMLNSGDFIYTASAMVQAKPVPVEPVTWGGLKARDW